MFRAGRSNVGRNCPSPDSRGDSSPDSCRTKSARHACGNFRFPTRAGAARTSSAGRSARGARNKKRTVSVAQTARFNLPTSACNGVSAIVRVRRKERPSPPRPSYPVGAVFFLHTGRTPFSRPRGRRSDEIPRNFKRAPAVKLSFPDPRGRRRVISGGTIRARYSK